MAQAVEKCLYLSGALLCNGEFIEMVEYVASTGENFQLRVGLFLGPARCHEQGIIKQRIRGADGKMGRWHA